MNYLHIHKTPPSGYLFPHSPQYNNPLLSGTPQSNPDVNTELSFPKIQAPNITAPILPLRSYDSRRSLENQRSGVFIICCIFIFTRFS